MEAEIKAIIEKNLPEQVGDLLKQRLEQAETDAGIVKLQNEKLINKNATIAELENQISVYKKMDERNSLLEAREKLVNDSERGLKIATLEFQLLAEKEKTEFSKNVAMGLVRNTEYKRTLFDSQSEPCKDQYGNTSYVNKTQNSNENKSAE